MKIKTSIAVVIVAALSLPALSFAKEHEENLKASQVPAAVQKSAEKEAKGGKIMRWEKEGKDYEAVIEKDGKEWGMKFDAQGKMKGKHEESKEKEEKH